MKKAGATKKGGDRNFLIFAAVAIVAVAGVTYYLYASQQAAPIQQVADQATVESELIRLAALASEKSLQTEDLEALGAMVEGNEAAHHEFGELEALVRYGEYDHALHTIAFIDSTLKTGTHGLCPEHLVAHYYVFSKHGDAELADDSLSDAKEQIHEWEGPAREFNDRYPSGRTFDEIMESLEGRIAAIEAGDSSATDEEVLDLANRAICVEGGFEHGETSYNDRHDVSQ